jgi:predicted O-methyltransferase YrrM
MMDFVSGARRVARGAYERLMAPPGARAVERMLRDGLPPQLAPALRFLFGGRAPAAAEEAALRIEQLRAQIAARPDVYRFAYFDTPLGPVRLAERAPKTRGALTSHRLATALSVPRRWGMFLHLCADAFEAKLVLEIGACVGISGSYLASVRSRPHLLTLEGSKALAQIAQTSLAAISDRGEVVVGPFEQTLPDTLARLGGRKLDVAFVDGHHEEASTLHYVAAISPHLSSTALIVLDDIYLYEGMWRAWQTLSSADDAIAVNVGRFGLLVYDSGRAAGRRYDLARYTGHWRVGGPRARAIISNG